MRFIHAADLHIDSPLRGLRYHDGAPVERLQSATRQAFQNLIQLALERRVDFVILAGDLFDGPWPDVQTGLWTCAQLRRLLDAGIQAYFIRGNHDAESRVRGAIHWPENLHEFPTDKPHTFTLEDLGVALHGQGFSQRDVQFDLAATYPDPIPGLFNIGILHTSLTGHCDHDSYAPTSEQVLLNRQYDYWALGHIHTRMVVHERPWILFSGNTQGRHVRESGKRGCTLVTCEDGAVTSVEFVATDTVRWDCIDVQLTPEDDMDVLLEKVQREMENCLHSAEGRFRAARVVVRGPCRAHDALCGDSDRVRITDEIRHRASEWGDELWLEKIMLQTLPTVNVDQLRRNSDVVGALLTTMSEIRNDQHELEGLSRDLTTAVKKHLPELVQAGLEFEDIDQIQSWVEQAEGILVSRLLGVNA